MISQANGCNIYEIPIQVVTLKCKSSDSYDDISYGDLRRLYQEIKGILNEDKVI